MFCPIWQVWPVPPCHRFRNWRSFNLLDVAVDNSVLSLYATKKILTNDLRTDRNAFEEMITLSRKGRMELGGPWTTLTIENLMKSGECRKNTWRLEGIVKNWPVPDPDQKKTDDMTRCLHGIMQDPGANDSRQLVLIQRCTEARHLVTVDYAFYRQFSHRKKDVVDKCGVKVSVMRPSDFMVEWRAGTI